MKKKRRIENRIIAVILCMAILFSQVNIADAADLNPSGTNTSQVVLSDETNMSNDEASTESTVSNEINGTTESESSISEETNENSKNNESKSSNENVKAESTDNIDAYYKDSKICIYNYEQLKQIGSDAYVYTGDKDGTIGSGDVVKSEGTELKYGADAQYILMNDIQMNSEQMWLVPDSFTGTITGTKLEENETPTLYDKETDTIYIYNPYQLMVLAQEESETEPVMSLDYDAPQFGMGQMIYPDGEVSKDEVAEIMDISLELRRRVKEQLKKIGGMEFYDVNFSYIDNDSFDEHFVTVPEQGGGKMIPEGMGKPGCLYTVSKSKTGMIGCYRLETQMMPGNGKLTCTGIGSGKEPKEATNTAFNYLKANGNAISGSISTTTKDYIINYQDMQGLGMTGNLALPTLIAISSAALSKPPISSLAVLGEISIGGTLIKVEDLASTLQVCLDSGAKKVLLPITSAADLGTVPSDLVGAFSLIFYSSPEEAVYKALGVE